MKSNAAKSEAVTRAGRFRARLLLMTVVLGAFLFILLSDKSCAELDLARTNDTIRLKA